MAAQTIGIASRRAVTVGRFPPGLAPVGVTQLLSREPSLEELFLARYGAEPSSRDGEVASNVG